MVNTNFYTTLNELMSRVNGVRTAVIDYNSFVDAGKVLSSLDAADLANEFLSPLMNKVQKTIADAPAYAGMMIDMYAGTLDYGVLEMLLLDRFYAVEKSTFDGGQLVEGQTYTDQFKVSLPDVKAMYYTVSDSFQKTITIQDTDLRGAFLSPSAMDSFISKIFMQVTNSLNFANESARLGCFARMLKVANAETAEQSDENIPAVKYALRSIYNSKYGTTLSEAECLQNDSFVRFCVSTIKDISGLMAKPLDRFNTKDFQTFTPADYRKTKINSIFDKAVRVSVIDAYNPEYGMLPADSEIVPYWQDSTKRMQIEITEGEAEEAVYSSKIIACVYDRRACGVMLQMEDVTNDRNNKYRYTNYHWQQNRMFFNNDFANCVIFTLD